MVSVLLSALVEKCFVSSMQDFVDEIMQRFCVSSKRDFFWKYITEQGKQILMAECLLRLNFVKNVLAQCSHWRGLLSSLSIRVFFLLLFINIGVMSHEIANIGNSFSQILHFIWSSGWSLSSTYNSSSVYVLECIILFCLFQLILIHTIPITLITLPFL